MTVWLVQFHLPVYLLSLSHPWGDATIRVIRIAVNITTGPEWVFRVFERFRGLVSGLVFVHLSRSPLSLFIFLSGPPCSDERADVLCGLCIYRLFINTFTYQYKYNAFPRCVIFIFLFLSRYGDKARYAEPRNAYDNGNRIHVDDMVRGPEFSSLIVECKKPKSIFLFACLNGNSNTSYRSTSHRP